MAGDNFLYCDGFYIVELGDRVFDVCVINGVPRFARADDSQPIEIATWDALANCEGRWWEAAPFTKAD